YEGIPLDNLMNTKNVVYTVDSDTQMSLFGGNKGGQVRFDVLENEIANLSIYIKDYFSLEKKESKAEVKKKINKIVNDHLHFNINLKKGRIEVLLAENENARKRIRKDENDTIANRKQKEKQKEKREIAREKLKSEIKGLETALNKLGYIQETDERPY